MAISAVFFDVGETLIDKSRLWRQWAAYLGVPEQEFIASLEETIGRGEHHRRVLDRYRPGIDIEAARRERAVKGDSDVFQATDLYPDTIPCLRLRELGYKIGIAGNQPEDAISPLKSLNLETDFLASSATLGVEKPAPEFFERLAALADVAARHVAYVGDRLDNDVLPARAAGMMAVFIERGPWAMAQAKSREVALADVRLRTLTDLPAALASLTRGRQ